MTERPAKYIVMLGVHADSKQKGGIHSVVETYRAGGLFERWPIRYIGTVAGGSNAAKLRVFAAALIEFTRLLLTGKVALLHTQTSSRASFWRKSIFMLFAMAARRPVILHLHGSEFERFYREECGPVRQWLVRWVFSHVDRVIVLSSQWQKLIQAMAPAANVSTIYNPTPVAGPMSKTIQRSEDSLLFLGRFGARKGIFDLLRALQIVRREFPSVKLRCGGDGDIAGVKAEAARLGDCVNVLGWVSGEAKQREIAHAAVYVLPSYAEGLPMSILEAMTGGAPVVSTNIGGIPDAIEDGVEGFLIRPGDIEALADRIMRLLGSSELRAEFAAAARHKAQQHFSVEKVLAQVEALYVTLGARPRGGAITSETEARRDGVPA